MKLNTADPVARYGFTQLPNFILRNPELSANAKTVYSLLLSYAWHNNLCFPGQERLAEHMGSHISTVSLCKVAAGSNSSPFSRVPGRQM